MSRPLDEQTLAELIGELANSIPTLLRDEVELLKSQLRFALARIQEGAGLLVVAVALVVATTMLLVAAAVGGIAVGLMGLGLAPPVATTVATLIMAVVSAALALVLVLAARNAFQSAQQTIAQRLDAVSGKSASASTEQGK